MTKRLSFQSIFYYAAAQSPWFRYGMAALLVTLAALATYYFPVIGQRAGLLLFFFVIIQATFWLGWYLGLFALGLSLMMGNALLLLEAWPSDLLNILILNVGFCALTIVSMITMRAHRELATNFWMTQQNSDYAQSIAHIGSWRLNVQRNELLLSDENHRIFGIPKENPMTYETFLSIVHPDDREYVDKNWQAALKGEAYDIEHRIIVTNKVKWVRERAILEFDIKGALLGGFGTTQDITQRKRSELALQESQQRYASVIESAMDAVITIDARQSVVLFNAAAEKMFGCSADDVIGTSIERFIPARFQHEHSNHIGILNRTDTTHRKMGKLGVVWGLRANGEEFPIEASLSHFRIANEKSYTAILRDVTERVQAEFTLKEQLSLQNQLVKIAASVPGMICSFQLYPDGKVCMPYASQAFDAIYGLNHLSVANDFSPVLARIHPQDVAHVQETIAESARTLLPWCATFRYDHPTKGEIWIEGSSMPQRETDGSTLWHGYIQDVTQRKQVELALKERTERYELVLEGAQDAIWDWDVLNKRVHFSARWKALRGFAEDEVSDNESEWSSTIHLDDVARVLGAVQAHFEGKTPIFCEEYRIRCKDGSYKWILDRGLVQKDSAGQIIRMAGSENDITERKRAEVVLREQESQLRLIMDATPALMAYLDTDFRYLRVNKAFENWFGLNREDILGHTVPEVIPDKAWQIVHPYLERARAGEWVSFDTKLPCGIGSLHWVTANYVPDKDAEGTVKGIVVHVIDIDDRKQAELERQKFVSLADSSQEFIGMCDMNFKPFYINAAGLRLVGLDSLEQALQTPVQEFFFPEDQSFITEEFFPRVLREKNSEIEIRFRHFQTGEAIWMIYNVFFIEDSDGEMVGLATVSRDITERKRADAALRESERQNRFLANILQNSDQAFGIGWADGHLEYVNAAFEELTGFSRSELLAMDWAVELTPPEWKQAELAKLAELQSNQQSVRYEKEYFHKDGTRVPIELMVELASTDAGQPSCYFAFITDLTERKRADAALRESKQRMRLATETTGVGIWEWHVSSNKIRWDAQMFKIYGIDPMPDGFIDYSVWSGTVLPEDLPRQEQILQTTARNAGRSEREFRIQRADNQECRYIQAVEAARSNAQGEVEWVVGTNLDITEKKHAAQALQASEAQLALGVQVAGLALAEVDYTTDLIHLSAGAAKLIGVGNSAMVLPRSTIHATFHPDDRSELFYRIDQALNPAEDGWFAMDHRILWPDGQVRWLRARKQVFFTEQGNIRKPVRATLAIHDITTEKNVAEILFTNALFVRNVLDSLPEHIVVLDDLGIVTAVNKPWECFASDNNGVPSCVSVGANYFEVCRRSSAAGDSYAHEALVGLEAVLSGQKQEFFMEYPCPTSDRNLWFFMHVKRMLSNKPGLIISHLDITDRKHAEEALKNAQARLALIIEEVQAGYWDWNLETYSLYVSPEWKRQIGILETETINHREEWEDRLHPEDRTMVLTALENYIAGNQASYELEYRLQHQDGSYRWLHTRGVLLRDAHKHPTRMLGINLDITEYRQAKELNQRREQMEQVFRLYVASQTAAAIAHELNQPLTAISYYADVAQELLQNGNQKSQKLSEIMEKCSQQALRAGSVIRQLLTLLHKGEILSEAVNINDSVLEAFNFIKQHEQLGNFTVHLNLAADLPQVNANSLQLQKVLINLLHNSLEALQESGRNTGTINVSTYRTANDPATVQVTVCDSGKGVNDASMLKTIFQPFHSTKANGLGMGLVISRALIEAHNGKMWAEQNIGNGISIHFTLPFVL